MQIYACNRLQSLPSIEALLEENERDQPRAMSGRLGPADVLRSDEGNRRRNRGKGGMMSNAGATNASSTSGEGGQNPVVTPTKPPMRKDLLVIRTEAEAVRDHARTWLWGFVCGAGLVLAVMVIVRYV